MRIQLPVILIGACAAIMPAFGQAIVQPRSLAVLRGSVYHEACAARDRADESRAEFQKHTRPGIDAQLNSLSLSEKEQIRDRITVVAGLYQQVIDAHPRTQIASYCTMRLAGFYQYLGRIDEAVRLLQNAAVGFEGTSEEPKLAFEIGLIHAQVRGEAGDAIPWFERVPKPANVSISTYDESGALYLSVQQQLINAELKLKRGELADERQRALKKDFPQFVAEIEKFHQFAQQSVMAEVTADPPIPARVSRFYWLIIGNLVVATVVLLILFVKKQKRKAKSL